MRIIITPDRLAGVQAWQIGGTKGGQLSVSLRTKAGVEIGLGLLDAFHLAELSQHFARLSELAQAQPDNNSTTAQVLGVAVEPNFEPVDQTNGEP